LVQKFSIANLFARFHRLGLYSDAFSHAPDESRT
jgi:hypothetical protein